jgi:hypothetical protein
MMYCNALPAHAVPHHDTVGRNPQLPVIRRLDSWCSATTFFAAKAKFKRQEPDAAVPSWYPPSVQKSRRATCRALWFRRQSPKWAHGKASCGDRTSASGVGMRYVVGICLVTGFLIWDGGYNQGRYLDSGVRELRHILSLITG